MRAHRFAVVLALAGAAEPSAAAPPRPTDESGRHEIRLASECHGDVERHFVPEFRRRAWHYHRQPDCRPVETSPPRPDDCHRDVQRHHVPELSGRITHRHVGDDCRMEIFQPFAPGLPPSKECVQIGPLRYCLY